MQETALFKCSLQPLCVQANIMKDCCNDAKFNKQLKMLFIQYSTFHKKQGSTMYFKKEKKRKRKHVKKKH